MSRAPSSRVPSRNASSLATDGQDDATGDADVVEAEADAEAEAVVEAEVDERKVDPTCKISEDVDQRATASKQNQVKCVAFVRPSSVLSCVFIYCTFSFISVCLLFFSSFFFFFFLAL